MKIRSYRDDSSVDLFLLVFVSVIAGMLLTAALLHFDTGSSLTEFLSAVGTLGAVILSLHLSQHKEKADIEINVDVERADSNNMRINVMAANLGRNNTLVVKYLYFGVRDKGEQSYSDAQEVFKKIVPLRAYESTFVFRRDVGEAFFNAQMRYFIRIGYSDLASKQTRIKERLFVLAKQGIGRISEQPILIREVPYSKIGKMQRGKMHFEDLHENS